MLKSFRNYFTSNLLSLLITFLLLPFYTRYLSIEDFGILALSYVFGNLVAGVSSISISSATSRFFYKFKNEKKLDQFAILNTTNLLFLLLVFIFLGILIFNIRNFLSLNIFKNTLTAEIVFFSYILGCLARIFSYLMTIFLAQENSKYYSFFFFLNTFLSNIFSVILIIFFYLKAESRIYAGILAYMILIPAISLSQIKNFTLKINLDYLKKSISFSYPLMPDVLIGSINGAFDKVILNSFLGSFILGLYDVALKFSNVYKIAIDSLISIWSPFFMNSLEKGKKTNKKISKKYKIITILFFIFAIGSVTFIEEIIILMTTESFYTTMFVIPIIIFFIFIAHCVSIIGKGLVLFTNNNRHMFYSSLLGCILNIILILILISHLKLFGVVIASGVSSFISVLYLFIVGKKRVSIRIDLINILIISSVLIFYIILIFILMKVNLFFAYKILIKFLLLSIFVLSILKINNFNFKMFYKNIINEN